MFLDLELLCYLWDLWLEAEYQISYQRSQRLQWCETKLTITYSDTVVANKNISLVQIFRIRHWSFYFDMLFESAFFWSSLYILPTEDSIIYVSYDSQKSKNPIIPVLCKNSLLSSSNLPNKRYQGSVRKPWIG